ncbi:MAG: hypothetical protein OEV63_12610 [Gammaproteobacteria bacterium]|nr:hypothetical protein [Gammaproteobacteria bacterium]
MLIATIVVGSGCAMQPSKQQLLRLTESTLDIRNMQTRTFAASSEAEILAATAAALQDMEYNIDQIESPLGVITATKVSDADSANQKAGTFMLSLLCGCDLTQGVADKHRITITTVVLPSLAREGEYTTRITIQQVTFNKMEKIVSRSIIDDPVAYQSIFEKLSKALFLEVNENA